MTKFNTNLVERTIRSNFEVLWKKDSKIALALSGGVDSIALFHLLLTMYKDSYKELVVFHINHGLRVQSEEEERFVRILAKENNVKLLVESLNMNELKRDSHTSEEMKARELRYEAFSKMARKEKVTTILTAHHKNDVVENIVMRLLTGRSIDHNLTIEKDTVIKNLEIKRPLINILKNNLVQYAKDNNLKYYEDETNFNTDYTRNYVRHKILPMVNEVSSSSFDNLISFANYYRDINSSLKEKVLVNKSDFIINSEETINGIKITLDGEKLLKLEESEIYFILKNIIKEDLNIFDIKQKAIFTFITDIKRSFGNKSYDLRKNLKIVYEYGNIYVHKTEKKCYNSKIELIIDKIHNEKSYDFYQNNFIISNINYNAQIGFNKSDLPLTVTSKKDGDVIRRGSISKKLSRLFIDEKIPKERREKLPVVRNNNGVILGVLGMGSKINKEKKYDYYIRMEG